MRASARAGVGAAGIALVGCSDDQPQDDPVAQAEQAQQAAEQALQQALQEAQAQQSADETQDAQQQEASFGPGPHRGGVIRAWLAIEQVDSWDPHRSRRRQTQAAQSLMYQRVVRPASSTSAELVSDLCGLPEQPDPSTFVFTLQPGAAFWDQPPTNGRRISAHDIAWNINRQRDGQDAAGVPDPSFFRRTAYARTDAVEPLDDQTLRLTVPAPDAAYLASVHAAPFAWITSPEAAGEYGDGWRDDPSDFLRNSATGPYRPHMGSGFDLNLARSEHWSGETAWADGIVLSSGGADAVASQYRAGDLDLADFPLSNPLVRELREELPEHAQYERPYASAVELITPLATDEDGPLADPRVIRAIALSVDREALRRRLYGDDGAIAGLWPQFFAGWGLDEEALSGLPGSPSRREMDLAEAASLVSAAGIDGAEAIPFVTVDLFEGVYPGAGEAVRAMIAEATGIEVTHEFRPFADAIDQLRSGQRFCLLGWGPVPTQADPTDDWRRTLHSEGADRWSGGASPELDSLINQLGSVETSDRQAVAQEVQELQLTGQALQWRVPLVRGTQLGIHQPWLSADQRLFEYAWWMGWLVDSWLEIHSEAYPAERALPVLEEEEPAQ